MTAYRCPLDYSGTVISKHVLSAFFPTCHALHQATAQQEAAEARAVSKEFAGSYVRTASSCRGVQGIIYHNGRLLALQNLHRAG